MSNIQNIKNITLSDDDFNLEYYKLLNLNIEENNTSILFLNDIKTININILDKNRENIIISKYFFAIVHVITFKY